MLNQQFVVTGNWLFRWRSYLPLLLVIPLMIQMREYSWPFQSHRLQQIWELICLVVSLSGLAIRAYVVGHAPQGTSGRNTRGQFAASLNVTGLYSITRNPLYLGNFVVWLGIAMFCLEWRFVATFIAVFWLYYERIIFAEEEFLLRTFGDSFVDWSDRTPAFLPKFSRWRSPELSFSLRNVLRREYTGFLGVVIAFSGLCVLEHWIVERRLDVEPYWAVLMGLSTVSYLILRTLKKRTTILNVEGR